MTLQEIFNYLEAKGEIVTLHGDGAIVIEGLSTIQHGQAQTLSFFIIRVTVNILKRRMHLQF